MCRVFGFNVGVVLGVVAVVMVGCFVVPCLGVVCYLVFLLVVFSVMFVVLRLVF